MRDPPRAQIFRYFRYESRNNNFLTGLKMLSEQLEIYPDRHAVLFYYIIIEFKTEKTINKHFSSDNEL